MGCLIVLQHWLVRAHRRHWVREHRDELERDREAYTSPPTVRIVPAITMRHRNEQLHVSMNRVACYRTERALAVHTGLPF